MGFWNFSENRRFFADFWSIFWNFRQFLDAKSGFSKIFRKNPENFLKKKWKNLIGNKGIFGFLKNSSIFWPFFWSFFTSKKFFSTSAEGIFNFLKKIDEFFGIFSEFFCKASLCSENFLKNVHFFRFFWSKNRKSIDFCAKKPAFLNQNFSKNLQPNFS